MLAHNYHYLNAIFEDYEIKNIILENNFEIKK